ncbi:probable serine/threonine-protein kinase DDB_G0267686 [Bactrocera tryoni]|uniref:probable serine/threonine-protein kinase DDB_G0267686 n=1 Tax=Bactrocera tryoni TaxID=59916 RepID=UPI001A9867FD|nr:probable serine/threonine-protein kinase DDB_G0267686 [Bactrocera tryoni]
MGTKSPGGPQRCRLILQRCLAIQLSKPGHTPEDFWMYDSGYMIFQNFLAANAQCWWNAPLTAATRALKYAGHVAPGMLLVTAEPCALEVLRGAYARSVLKPPATYVISSVGDIDDCIVTPTVQGQFTPLPEALCDVIMDLTAEGHSATIENVRIKLSIRFPHMTPPATEVIYDTLAQLMQEQKIYQTAKGYFIFTPERRRSRSRPRAMRNGYQDFEETDEIPQEARTMLMTNAEALHSLYGEISTERDGDLTHQCIQTNLADVICGGNPNDKILYPRAAKRRSASFPTPRSLERRHSLRLFGSSKRLQRCASTRSLSKTYAQTLATDSSSSEYQSTDSSSPKKGSLLSRLFRRSGRAKQRQIETYSAQFPPAEWFNSRAVHLHSVGTQTADHDMPVAHTLSNSTFYDGSELSQRSLTLPRRHRRHMSSDSTFLISSRDCSPIRRRSPVYCSSSLPRSTQSIPATASGTTNMTIAPTSATSATKTNHSTATLSRLSAPNHTTTASAVAAAVAANAQKSSSKSVIGKHIFEQSPSRTSGTLKASATKRQSDNIIINGYASNLDSGKVSYRSVQSGPSSLESGKASSMLTSGPSSIDSGKVSFSKTSGHSSLDSQCSTNTAVVQPSPARSILVLNGSPRGTPRHQAMRARAAEQTQRQRASTPSRILEEITNQQKPTSGRTTSNTGGQSYYNGIPNSNSNNSITLQVTTSNGSQSSIPSTKIYVQNSPARSVITLENGKLMENSNVYIINNETTTNEKGEIIKKTLSKQETAPMRSQQQQKEQQKRNYAQTHAQTHSQTKSMQQQQQQQQQQQSAVIQQIYKDNSISENEANSETCDSISFISETSPDNLDTLSSTEVIDNSKFTKNINNDATMNNSRKLCLQLPQHGSSNIVYKNNVLKNESNPNSPSGEKTLAMAALAAKQDFEIAGSVGNLRFYEKNTKDTSHAKLMNSHCDLKNLNRYESSGNLQKTGNILQSNPAINSDDLAHILQKNIIAVGSEPNLALKDNNCSNASDKSVEKEALDRRFSLSKDPNGPVSATATGNEDLYNFPSLTDLSFNFTSLAAQKILQGVSLNSIDTLVELNMAAAAAANKEKQQNNQPTPVCTDYGMV